mmetsp:Transcript_152716/g.269553  ORF Transcript_152716/g.269553 Transcript_152716/m.269553 type:complete len:386 (-) Transcript_152716:57-1214(-)
MDGVDAVEDGDLQHEDRGAGGITWTRGDFEVQARLSEMRVMRVDDALNRCTLELKTVRKRHLDNRNERQQLKEREHQRGLRREARREQRRKEHKAATAIQSVVRSFFVRRFLLPNLLTQRAEEELRNSRIALKDKMLFLHQTIHHIAFLEEDKHMAAKRIQAWWRAILAKRVVQIVLIRKLLMEVHAEMSRAATKIQSIQRGKQARMGCLSLRMQREERMRQQQKEEDERLQRSVVKIQAHARRTFAQRWTQARRAELTRELEMGDSSTGHDRHGGHHSVNSSPTAAEAHSKTPRSQAKERRKREREREANAGHGAGHGNSSHGGGPAHGFGSGHGAGHHASMSHHRHHGEGKDAMHIDVDPDSSRKSYGAITRKAKKVTSPKNV